MPICWFTFQGAHSGSWLRTTSRSLLEFNPDLMSGWQRLSYLSSEQRPVMVQEGEWIPNLHKVATLKICKYKSFLCTWRYKLKDNKNKNIVSSSNSELSLKYKPSRRTLCIFLTLLNACFNIHHCLLTEKCRKLFLPWVRKNPLANPEGLLTLTDYSYFS